MGIVAAPNSNVAQEIMDLRARLSATEYATRQDAIADVLGMPKYSDIPRPGVASAWGIDDWLAWGKPHGFTRLEDSTDCNRIGHPDFAALIVSRSKSSKEYRAGMNTASDFRKEYAALLESSAIVCTIMIDSCMSGREWRGRKLDLGSSAAEGLAILRRTLRDPALRGAISSQLGEIASNADRDAWAALPKILKVLDSDFGISGRMAFQHIGMGDSAERMVSALKYSTKTPPSAALIMVELRNLLDLQRDLRKQQTEAKAAERAALRNQREGKRDPGSQIKYDNDVKQARAQLKTGFASARTMLESALKLVDRQMNYVDDVPLPAYPGAPVELIEQRDAALAERDTAEVERDALKARVEEDRHTINRQDGRIAELEKGSNAGCQLPRQIVEDLINTVLTRLNTTDIGQILTGIKECRAQAAAMKATLYATNPTPTGLTPVSV